MKTEIEVRVVSKQHIKPSSPTPCDLGRLRLSFLDEIQLEISLPFVLFYPRNPSVSNLRTSELLKSSLSYALTMFYPLAGRVKNNSYADCNDEGALFVEAQASCNLSDLLENKYSHRVQSHKFVPLQPNEAGDLAAFFQVTFFDCGGCAISFAMSHKLGDAFSQFVFLNSWAAVARGNEVEVSPFGSAALFPPKNLPDSTPLRKEKTAVRVFTFESATVAALRAKHALNGENLSKFQALATFIWSRFLAVAKAKEVSSTKYGMHFPVNLRPRTVPPMPELSFGNLFTTVSVVADKEDVGSGVFCYRIAKKMKEATENVNEDYVEKLRKSDDHLNSIQQIAREVAGGRRVRYTFTSLCNFPTYDVDFGWGKPEWVAMGGMFLKNFVIFLDAKEGDMIEAWVSLKEDEMAKFEVDDELLSHVSSSSSSPSGNFRSSKMDAQSRL